MEGARRRLPALMPGLDHLETGADGRVLMDRHPVTNREYKRFVDDGGYTREEFWREPFLDGERTLSRAEAMARLTDAVGQPGPAKWEMGDHPAGEDDHPVTGVSWYEAAAYAAWAGKALPTIFHWNRVAMTFSSALIVPFANLSGRGTVAVGSTNSVNRFGVHDLAGNVREWMVNSFGGSDQRYIPGGGWNDMGYAFVDAYGQAPRSIARRPTAFAAFAPWSRIRIRSGSRARSSSPRATSRRADGVRRRVRVLPAPVPLRPHAARREDRRRAARSGRRVADHRAGGGVRRRAHAGAPLPAARGRAPYQTVVLFPGSLAMHNRSFNRLRCSASSGS